MTNKIKRKDSEKNEDQFGKLNRSIYKLYQKM